MSAPFPWDEALRLALGVLRWSPGDFWAATPPELVAAYEGLFGARAAPPAGRSDLQRLMAAFPDG